MFTESDNLSITRGRNGARGSCICSMSNCYSDKRRLICGFSHTDKDTRAIDPPLGIGNDLPSLMKVSSISGFGSDIGAIILTW